MCDLQSKLQAIVQNLDQSLLIIKNLKIDFLNP